MGGYDFVYKLIVLGDSSVGKSAIIRRFADDTYSESTTSTIGVDFKFKTIDDDGKVVKLEIWDPAGQERYRNIISSVFRGLHGVVYVYDITNRASFDNMKSFWVEELSSGHHIHSDVLKLLVGNKADLADSSRVVKFDEGQGYAQQLGIPFLETSAKQGTGIDRAFRLMSTTIREAVSKRGYLEVPRAMNSPRTTLGPGTNIVKLEEPGESRAGKKKPCCD